MHIRPGRSSAARQPAVALKWPLRRSKNPPPTKNALKIHHFKGSRKFLLRSAVKLFPGLYIYIFTYIYT